MPSVVAIVVKCPECGARLDVKGEAESTTCSYCGTSSRIQRRTQVLQRRVPLAEAPHLPKPVAHQVRSPLGMIFVALVGGLFPLAIVGFVVVRQCGWLGGHNWSSAVPLIADVDGDGVDDLIGIDRNVQRDTMKLAAFSGKDGHVLWRTASLGTYSNVYRDTFQYASGVIVLWDEKAHLLGFDAKTGDPKWSTTTPEVVSSSCVQPGVIGLATADKRQLSIDPATGAAASKPAKCDATHFRMRPLGATSEEATAAGMSVRAMYDPGDGPRIAAGTRSPGTPVPMIAAFDAGGALLWKSEVPGSDVLSTKGSEPKIAISATQVAAVYERDNGRPPMLAVFDRNTGKRAFEVPMKKVFQNVLSSVRFTNHSIVVSMWNSLQAYDLRTGERQFTIGD